MKKALMSLMSVAILAGTLTTGGPGAAAQGWASGRDPCSARMLTRYYGLIEAQPDDTWALGKLLACTTTKALIARYETKISGQGNTYNYRIILGNLFMQQKNYVKAAEAYKGATAQDEARYVGHERLGEALRKQGKSEEARAAYDKALARTTEARLKKRILRSLVDLTMTTRAMDKAREYFKALVALEPGNRLLRMEFAQMLTRNLLYKEALAEYVVLIKHYRGNAQYTAELHKEVGKVHETMGQDPEAKKSYWTAMRYLTPNHWMVDELYQRIIAIYRRKNDLRSLIAELEKKWTGRGFFEWKILSGLYDETGDDERAIKAYQTALRLQPQAIDVRARLISMLTRLNRQKEAIGVLETQVRLAPGEPRFYLDLAEMLWGEGLHDRALGVLARLGRLFARDPSVHIALADHYNKWGKPKLAMEAYQTLVRIEPRDPGHLVSLGEQFWQRGEKAKALAAWTRILGPGMYQSREEAHAALAGIYAEHDMNKEAIEQYEKTIKLAPKNVEHRRGVALALQKMRRFDEAVAAWQAVIQMSTDKSQQGFRREGRTAIIDIWASQNLLDQRLGSYRARFDGRPPDLDSGYFLGEAYVKSKRINDAEKVFLRILEIDRDQVEALLALEQIYRESYRLRKAIAILERLIQAMPRRAREFHDRIALLYLQLYQDHKAIEHATAALKLSKNDASGWARLGAIYEKKEDFVQAIDAYKKAIKLNSRLFKISFALARLYMMQGNHVGAVALYHEVIRRSPDEEHVRQASRLAVDIDEYLGTLEDLERELIPLAFTYTQKKTYRVSLVRLYARLVPRLAFEARFAADEPARKRAGSLLLAIGQRALKPLLEALSEKEGAQRDIAIDVLGHLGNKNAAPPLVRLALQPPPEDAVAPVTPPTAYPHYGGYRPAVAAPSPKVSGHLALKVRALVAAGRLSDPRTAPDLAKLLEAKEAEVREAAAWALALLRNRSAQRPLETALEDPKVGVQIFACVGLGAIPKPPVARLLAAAEDLRRRPEVRAACAFGLGLSGDRRAVAVLLRLLADERPIIATKAAWALGLVGAPEITPILARLVWVRQGPLQDALAWALARSVAGRPYGPGLDSQVSLVEGRVDWASYLGDLKPLRPAVDASSLGLVLGGAAKPLADGLAEALGRHRDLVLRLLAGLDENTGGLSLPMLGARLGASELATLAPALAPIRERLGAALPELCRSEDPDIRAHALRLAAKVDHPKLTTLVEQGLGDPEALVRRAAGTAAVIAAGRQASLREALVGLLVNGLARQPWYEMRERIERLGELGGPRAVPDLVALADSTHGFVAEAAVRSLGRIRDGRGTDVVVRALRYPVSRVRLAAVEALVRIDPARARRELPAVADRDRDPLVRAAAARCLAPRPRP